MNEIKHIHLGRQQFTIAAEAYAALRTYLAAIEAQPAVQQEVTKEVEARMAELLRERGVQGDKVVLLEDINFLKQQLGEPGDFIDEDATTESVDTEHPTPAGDKRLFRDTAHGAVAGVASGLAVYTGIPVLVVRLLFIILVFASGFGIIAYALLWILMPEAKTTSEQLQMQGQPVTVDSLKKIVDNADIEGAGKRAGRSLTNLAANFSMIAGKVIAWIIGTIFTIIGFAALIAVITFGFYTIINGGQPIEDFALPKGTTEIWAMLLVFGAAITLSTLFLLMGISLIRRKLLIPGWIAAVLTALLVLFGIGATVLTGHAFSDIRDRYNAARIKETRQIEDFNNISVQGWDTRISYKQSPTSYIELYYHGPANKQRIQTTVTDGTLHLKTDDPVKNDCKRICIFNRADVEVIVHAPTLEDILLRGGDTIFTIDEGVTHGNLQAAVQRNTGNHLSINRLYADKVVWTDKIHEDVQRVSLQGVKFNSNNNSSLAIHSVGGHVAYVDQLVYESDRRCEWHNGSLFLQTLPLQLTVDGQAIATDKQLTELKSTQENNTFNCILRPFDTDNQ